MIGLTNKFPKEIKERLITLKNSLATGYIDHIAEYKEICGEIRGLETSLDVFNEVFDQVMKEDRDDVDLLK